MNKGRSIVNQLELTISSISYFKHDWFDFINYWLEIHISLLFCLETIWGQKFLLRQPAFDSKIIIKRIESNKERKKYQSKSQKWNEGKTKETVASIRVDRDISLTIWQGLAAFRSIGSTEQSTTAGKKGYGRERAGWCRPRIYLAR